ncbi:MAG: hypothetical protein K8J08_05970 [Thermoanaerobaculia bacterium]|nr:hypothetical protein [Thermoanaerobaculia bacterium]
MTRKILCLGLGMILSLAAAPGWSGTYYQAKTVTDSKQGGVNTTVEAWVDGDKAKVLFTDSDQPMLGEGGYLLTNDGGRTMFFVDPDEGTYMRWDLDAMLGGLGGAMQSLGPMMKMDFTNYESEKVSEGAGPELHGLATTHYVFKNSYDMEIKVMGMGQKTHNETHNEMWTTTQLADAGFAVWLRNEPPKTGIEGLDTYLADQVSQVQGFPLKTIVTTTSTDQKKGRTNTTVTTTEVTTLREEAIDPATFVLDRSLKETEMPSFDGMFDDQ